MKTKPLLITVFLLALCAVGAWWLTGGDRSRGTAEKPLVGETLLAPDILEAAARIELAGGETGEAKVVFLKEAGGHWVLPDYHGIPADFQKLSSLTRNLLEGKVDRHVTSNPDRMGRLQLGEIRIDILNTDAEPLWQLAVGGGGPGGGHFIRLNGQQDAYLTSPSFPVDTDPANWPAKRPLGFDENDVARVEFLIDDQPLAFTRPAAGAPFEGVDLAENERPRSEEVSRLVSSLIRARFKEAVAKTEPDAVDARANTRTVRLDLFNGETYTLKIGRRPAYVPSGLDDTEMSLPGPVFIFYESSAPDDPWRKVFDQVELKFSDQLFSAFPATRRKLIETAP